MMLKRKEFFYLRPGSDLRAQGLPLPSDPHPHDQAVGRRGGKGQSAVVGADDLPHDPQAQPVLGPRFPGRRPGVLATARPG